jgi:hypothetical protein
VSDAPAILLCCGMVAAIFFGNPFSSKGPLASHFPWGANGSVMESADTRSWKKTLEVFDRIVPEDATIAFRSSFGVHAVLANRPNAWWIGNEAKDARYYVFLGEAPTPQEKIFWDSSIAGLRRDKAFKVVYEGDPGKPLLVFENLRARPIPRDEKLLGWSAPLRVLRSGR